MAQRRRAAAGAPPARTRRRSSQAALKVATSARRPVAERVAALAEVPLAVGQSEESLRSLLDVLRDPNEPPAVRLATLQTFQAATFSSADAASWRGDYLTALRSLVEDPDPELRQRVLGLLAREKDGFVQERLLEGLRDSAKALVSPEKALQLLSYDVHAEAYPVARVIADQPPNPAARREALRLLAADAGSAPVFERILRDKGEPTELRQMAAATLQATNPRRLQEDARAIVLDDSEDEELQATCLAALTQFGDGDAVAQDQALLERVDDLSKDAPPAVHESAQRFLEKYGR